MSPLNVKLKRSPRSLIVGNHTITIANTHNGIEPNRTDTDAQLPLQKPDEFVAPEESEDSKSPLDPQDTSVASNPNASHGQPGGALPRSVGSVTSDASKKVITPLGRSNAVPVLSGATHEVVTAEEMGFGSVSEDELADLKRMLADAADLVTELQEQHRQSLSELQEVAVELASAAASWLVGIAIERDAFAVDDLIRKALQQLDIDQPVRVRLNPADHKLLTNLMRSPESRDLLNKMTCVDDPALTRGSCRVESGRRILLTDMNSRLEDIRRSWMEKLDDAQIERRGDDSDSRTLRRFPDRRETA